MTETMSWRRPWLETPDGGADGDARAPGNSISPSWPSVSAIPPLSDFKDGYRRFSTTSLPNILSRASPPMGELATAYTADIFGGRSPKRPGLDYDQEIQEHVYDNGFRRPPEAPIRANDLAVKMANVPLSPPRPPAVLPSATVWLQKSPKNDPLTRAALPPLQCSNCKHLTGVVHELVTAVVHLDGEMKGGVAIAVKQQGQILQAPDVSEKGLRKCLEWALGAIQSNASIARDRISKLLPFSRDSHAATQASDKSLGTPSSEEREGLRTGQYMREQGDALRRTVSETMDERRSKYDYSVPRTSSSGASRRNSILSDAQLPFSEQSPHGWTGSGPPSTVSPVQVQRTSMLPSPSSLNFPTNTSSNPPSISPSSVQGDSVQAAHFRDLQHQVSTKTLALQTLQQEHDNLLSAYSRSQTRHAALEKKAQVSDAEINELSEERVRLEAQVDQLQSQIEELTKSRDDARKQSVANGGQYMQIMSMASRLEAQSTADKKKWKQEKDGLEDRIRTLEQEKEALIRKNDYSQEVAGGVIPSFPFAASSLQTPLPANSQALIVEPSIDTEPLSPNSVRDENARLRARCRDLENTLVDLRGEVAQLMEIGQRFARRTGLTPLSTPDPVHDSQGRNASAAEKVRTQGGNVRATASFTDGGTQSRSSSPEQKRKRQED